MPKKFANDPLHDLKREMRQDTKEIIAAINRTFGKRVLDLEGQVTIHAHQIAKLQSS